ncbi:hypothetical protein HN51_010473, partial [Arachis hypogaea]
EPLSEIRLEIRIFYTSENWCKESNAKFDLMEQNSCQFIVNFVDGVKMRCCSKRNCTQLDIGLHFQISHK